jgi:hypothetical protein
MKPDLFAKLLVFLRQLDDAKISYRLRHSREDAIMVEINVPGERWEVEFLEDGDVEVERFKSNGDILDEQALEELFIRHSESEQAIANSVNQKEAIAK